MRPLRIVWQRLVVSRGQTCPRCRSTQEALESAVVKLKAALGPLGFVPVLETRELDEDAFRGDPSESNRIWIAGRTLEEWLGARVGSSQCCAVCGPSECRTVEVEGAMFEAIPEDLILRASLVAAAQMLGSAGDSTADRGDLTPARRAASGSNR
jgi:hypothetical protein